MIENKVIRGNAYHHMKEYPDNSFDVAIVYPFQPVLSKDRAKYPKHELKQPSTQYFNQLFRVSKNQIIFGANYCQYLWPHIANKSKGYYLWNQLAGFGKFDTGNMIYCSFIDQPLVINYLWKDGGAVHGEGFFNGAVEQSDPLLKEEIIHPFQVPIDIFRGLIKTHLKPGMTIIDTHCRHAGLRIASDMCKVNYMGFEREAASYHRQEARYHKYKL